MQFRMLFLAALTLGMSACSAVPPVSPGAPRPNQPPYPAMLTETTKRTEAAIATWIQIANQQGVTATPQVLLQPITATIRSLPENLNGSFYLAKIGTSAQMNEEEMRESLRRFLNEWKTLIGTDPSQLTLIDDAAAADGTRTARYEQRPFTYPLRGDYGKVEVRFAPDRRILSVSSTAVPESERIQSSLNAALPQLKAEDVPAKLIGRLVTYQDSSGSHTYTITAGTQTNAQQLVIYPRLNSGSPAALEFHLAWEIRLANAPVNVIYFDALLDEVIATAPSQ